MSTEEAEDKDQAEEDKDKGELPELSDEGKEQVKQMQQAYDDDRETAVLPGTDNTITGVAINEWLDDDGNPKFGKDEQKDGGEDKQPEDDGGEDKQPEKDAG